MAKTPYQNLYYSTRELVNRFKPSLSNTFNVFINGSFQGIGNDDINFMAYEAVLPGTSYETAQVYGDRMGRIEQYPTRRIYPNVDVSFYVDQDYKVLKFFEGWMALISPNIGSIDNSYVRYNYADSYESDVIITKFERNFRNDKNKLVKAGVYAPPPNMVTYTLRNAYPVNLISVPVSYDGTNILRTTVTFNYDVYNFQLGGFETDGGDKGSSVSGPGSDPEPQTTQQANILGNTQAQLNALQAQAYGSSIIDNPNISKSKQKELISNYNKTLGIQ
jgi:hypothetical protein